MDRVSPEKANRPKGWDAKLRACRAASRGPMVAGCRGAHGATSPCLASGTGFCFADGPKQKGNAEMPDMQLLLREMVDRNASDLHVTAGSPPKLRIDGRLANFSEETLSPEESRVLCYSMLRDDQISRFEQDLELDVSFGINNLGRFRMNVFMQRGAVGTAIRLIPTGISSFSELGLPRAICEELCGLPKGLVLVTGATGSGKSTTLAAMIDHINTTRRDHIITIEDPIEFVHENKNCLINQREVGNDTRSIHNALRTVLREDPDVILIGEMRDMETVEAALTMSETGHLTFGTLHTSDCVQTINRIVDIFPGDQQRVRTQLSFTLQAVFCQQLLPKANGSGRVLCPEVMVVNAAIRSLIREDKAHQIYSAIQTGGGRGMATMNQSLLSLYRANLITYDDAMSHTLDPDDLKRTFQKN